MQLVRDTPFNFGYLVAQLRPPRDAMTVVVKATFALVHDGVCTPVEQQPLCTGPVHYDDDETASLHSESDVVPYKPRGECTLVGTCHAPGGKLVPAIAISFRVGTLRKRLGVFGDRYWKRASVNGMSDPVPFSSMPLRYERSFGGPGYPKNPVGRGMVEQVFDGARRRMLPNIEDPAALMVSSDMRPAPAGTFPIPSTWPQRFSKVGTYNARWLKTRWPGFPDDFDYTYFNAAPEDQQINGYFRGDEEIELQNLHPTIPTIRTRLPGVRARCFLDPAPGHLEPFREVALVLDTIAVDSDAGTVTCLWRGVTEVSSVKLREIGRVFVLHEPLEAQHPLEHYRAAMHARIEQLEHEDDEALAPPAEAPTVDAEATMVVSAAQLRETGVESSAVERTVIGGMPPTADGADPFAELREKLLAAGVDPDEPSAPPAAPDLAALADKLEGLFAALGADAPAEAAEILAALRAPDAPSGARPREPESLTRNLRDEVRSRFARGESLARMDWTGADLSELDLSGADFGAAVLTRAKLTGSVLEGANLESAILADADASGARFAGAKLARADVSGLKAPGADFTGADLSGATGTKCHLAGCRFEGAKFAGAVINDGDFSSGNFHGATLVDADLSGCVLREASFARAVLTGASLYGVSAERVNMEGCDLTGLRASEKANFAGGRFQKARANGSLWTGAMLDGADFSFAELDRADFSAASLLQALLIGCRIREGKFQEARLVGARIMQSDLFKAAFEGADLTDADLRGSSFYAAEFWRAVTRNARLELADLTMTKLA